MNIYEKLKNRLLEPHVLEIDEFIRELVDDEIPINESQQEVFVCFECGNHADHLHHVVPRIKGGIRTIPLCTNCHGKAHGISFGHGDLTKLGLQRALKLGKRLGRPMKRNDAQIANLRTQGLSYRAIAKRLGVSHGAVQRSLNTKELK